MAAIYLDGGLEAAREAFHRAWAEPLSALTEAQDVEAKSALQEWAMARALPIPLYTMQSRTGPAHAPSFAVEVSIPGHGTACASGPNLRAAEKAAAAILLQQIQGTE